MKPEQILEARAAGRYLGGPDSPGGTIPSAAYGLAAGTITAPQAGETAGDLAFGPKGTKGGTGFDRLEDSVFGKVERKKKEKSSVPGW